MKKNLMNRVLSLMLAAVMAVSLLPAATISARADGTGGVIGGAGGVIGGDAVGNWSTGSFSHLITKYSVVRFAKADWTDYDVLGSVYISKNYSMSTGGDDSGPTGYPLYANTRWLDGCAIDHRTGNTVNLHTTGLKDIFFHEAGFRDAVAELGYSDIKWQWLDIASNTVQNTRPGVSNYFLDLFYTEDTSSGRTGVYKRTPTMEALLVWVFNHYIQEHPDTTTWKFDDLASISNDGTDVPNPSAIVDAFFENGQCSYAGTNCYDDKYVYRVIMEPTMRVASKKGGTALLTMRDMLTSFWTEQLTVNNTNMPKILANASFVASNEFAQWFENADGELERRAPDEAKGEEVVFKKVPAAYNPNPQTVKWSEIVSNEIDGYGYGLGILSSGDMIGDIKLPVSLTLKKVAVGTNTSGLSGNFKVELWGNLYSDQAWHDKPAGSTWEQGIAGYLITSGGTQVHFTHTDIGNGNSHGISDDVFTLRPGESVTLFASDDFAKMSTGSLVCNSMGYKITEVETPGMTCTISSSESGREPVVNGTFEGSVSKDSKNVTITAENKFDGLTISKEVDAASLAKDDKLKDIEWFIDVAGRCSDSGTQAPIPDNTVSYVLTKADGSKVNGTCRVANGGHIYDFGESHAGQLGVYLKHGESVTFTDFDHGYKNLWVALYEHSVDGVYDITKYTTTLNGKDVTGAISHGSSMAAVAGPFKLVNSLSKTPIGPAHLIVDYNFPGTAASNDSQQGITADMTVECGTHNVGDTVQFQLAGQFAGASKQLGYSNKGDVVWSWTETKTDSDTETSAGGAVGTATGTATANFAIKFDGLWTAAEGGTEVTTYDPATGAWSYTLKHPDLTVLYAHWKTEKSLVINVDAGATGGGGGTGTGTLPDKGHLYTVYYDQNYAGGGITSALWGKFHVPIASKAAYRDEVWLPDDEGNLHLDHYEWLWKVPGASGGPGPMSSDGSWNTSAWTDAMNSQWDISRSYEITVEFTHPADPERIAYDFIGWTAEPITWTMENEVSANNISFPYDNVYAGTDTKNANIAFAKSKLAAKNKSIPKYAVMFEADGLTPKGVESTDPEQITYYAVWMAKPICWIANGGVFKNFTTDGANHLNADKTVYHWPGGIYHQSFVPIVGGNGGTPERVGYEFDQWYFQPACTIPLVEMDHGIQPNRNYYAGWIPQPVLVNYYDTREGTSLITTQWYEYDDVIDLLGSVKNTNGEHFVSWDVGSRGSAVHVDDTARLNVDILGSDVLVKHDGDGGYVKGDNQVNYQNYWVIDLYANYEHQTCSYTVTINWDDYTDNDGIRPQAVTVGLIDSRGNGVIREQRMTEANAVDDNTWVYTFDGLDITTSDASTEKITYSFCILSYEDAVDNTKYTIADTEATSADIQVRTFSKAGTTAPVSTYSYALNRYTTGATNGVYKAYSGSIYMNHNLITTGDDVKFTIQWDDEGDNDGVRPGAVTLVLYAKGADGNFKPVNEFPVHNAQNGVVSVSSALCEVTNDGNTWTYIFPDCQKYDNGTAIEYTVRVTNDNARTTFNKAGYTVQYLNPNSSPLYGDVNGCIISRDVELATIPVEIIWDDEENRDGQRPDSVSVALMAYQWNDHTFAWEEQQVDSMTIKADATNTMTSPSWTATFDYNKVYNGGVRRIYHLVIMSDLNVHLPEGACPYTWVETDHGNQYPTNNNRDTATMYNVRANARKPVAAVTISQNTNTVSVTGQIFWNDHQNNDGKRPSSVIMQLYSHTPGTDVVTPVEGQAYRVQLTGEPTADSWYHTFENVPKYVDGQSGVELVYSIKIVEVDGQPLYGTYIVDDNGPQETMTYYEATYLYEAPDGMTSAGGTTETDEFILSDRPYVKLSHTDETQSVDFSIDWHDANNQDHVRPSSVKVNLWKQVGDKAPVKLYDEPLTFTSTDSQSGAAWTKKLTGLPNRENGEKITYILDVDQDEIDRLAGLGYTLTVEGNIIEMYRTTEVSDLEAYITWDDADNNDGYRPENVTATLYKNGAATDVTVDLNETNGWKHVFKNLDIMYINRGEAGTPVVYSVKVNVPEKYTVEYKPESTVLTEFDKDTGDGYVPLNITLAHAGDTKTVPVTVNWNDDSDHDRKRPESITLQLYADGVALEGKTLTLRAEDFNGNQWTGEFADMQTYTNNGTAVYYTVKVADATATNGVYSIMTAGTTVYLAYKPVTSVMYVSFNYSDNNNADGHRPSGLYLQLTANGEPVDEAEYKHTVNLDPKVDGYRIEFGALPVYAGNGQKIAYNVIVSGLGTEMFDGEGYVASYTNDITLSENSGAAVNQVIVKLTRAANTKTVQGNIYWFDVNNMSGHRPDRMEIRLANSYNSATTLYVLDAAAGTVTEKETGRQVGEVTVNEWTGDSSVWSYSISGLRANYMTAENDPAGIEYRMTVDTASITPYYPMVQTGTTLNASLTSSDYETYKTQATTELTMDVQWIDNDDAWGYRPNTQGITVELMAGDDVYKTVVLTSANAVANNSGLWTYTFENLPSFRNGAGVAWTVRVKDADKYTQSTVITESEHAVVKFVQSQGFDFTINWADSNNDDNRRPESLTLLVKADGAEVGRVEFAGENNQWKSHITGLPVWSESDPDRAIQYTFQWSDESEAVLTEKGYLASSTKNGVETKSDAFYWLSAQPFGENTAEAGYDILTGKYQWETTLSYDKEVADYAFDISFRDDGDRDGIRPESLNIELLADGKVIDTQLLTVDKDTASYQLKWEDMEVWNKAQAIVYTIRVNGEVEGYEIAYNEAHTSATLTHEPERVFVKGMIFWDDSTEVKSLINAQGEYLRDYEFIGRASVNMTFYADEQAVANMRVSRSVYGTDPERMKDAYTVTYPWMGADKAAGGVYKYRDHGTEIQYTIGVTSSELNALYAQGYSLTYDAEKLQATVTHDLYNLDGQVYYLRDTSEDFLLKNGEAMVTAYLQVGDEYIAQQSVGTDANGRYRFTNLKQGLYIVRAVYDYNGHAMAGTSGVTLDRRDASADVIIDRDAANDGFRYEYSASGQAFYQTDRHLASTIHTVPEGSIVLLYKITDGQSEPEYLMMTKTDADGRYTFEKLQPADYLVTVVFNFEDGVYTYDNAEAVADGLSFNITGMDAKWPDIIKQVNKSSDVTEKPDAPVTPEEPEKKSVPCSADGYVFESVNGVHTTTPIENVDVHVYTYMDNIEIGHTKTDENGYWNIEGLAVGDYTAVFSKQGQSSRVLVFHITEDDFSIGTKQWVNNDPTQYFDESEETATGIVSGIVLGEDGRPAHTLVELYKVNEDGSESLYDFQHTDDQGKYEFTVMAGFQYQVRIYNVDTTVDVFDNDVGYPDNALTTLEEYQVSGKFVYHNVPQVAEAVFAYRQDSTGNWKMVTGTLSDTDGNYVLHLKDAGNYRVVEYLDEGKFVDKYVTVGYDRALPQVTRVDATHYTISGTESFDSLILRKNDSGVVKGRYDAKGTAYTGYTIANQDAGDYTLTLVQNGVEKTYYVSCPADRACAQTYTVTVSGEVVDEKGNAIIGSEVTLKNSDGEVIGTQMILSDGKYEFVHLPEGQYSVEVEKYFVVKSAEGSLYTKSTAEADSFGNAYADGLPGGQAWVWNINASRVSGQVTDLDGAPVADLTVYFMANDKTVYGAKTDAEGKYEIGLPAGEYEVSYVWMQDADHGVTGKAGNLTVAFGHEYEHDIQKVSLKQVTLFTYRPEADGSQTPVSNVTLKVMYADGKLAGMCTTDDRGKTDVRLMAGEYSVEAEYQDGKTTVKATASLNIGTDAEGELVLPVELLAGYILAGQVVDADGNAVADAIVNYRNGELTGKVYTDDNGRFEIAVSANETGEYQLFVNGRNLDSGEYESVTVNGDVDGVILTLAPVTEDKAYVVSGRVVDSHGNPVEDAEVILKVGSDKVVYDKSSTDADGRFKFNVASGTYYLSASYMDESGKVYVTNAETMAHASEEDTDDVLVLLNAYDLTVKVVDGNGNPVENAKVAWRFDGSRTTEGYFDLTDVNGETVKALFNSNYELQASTKGRKSQWIDVKLPDDSLMDETGRMVLTIQLGAAGLDHVQSEPEVIVNADGSMKVYGWIAAPENGVILAVDNILVTLERYGVEETAEGEQTEWVVVGEQYADNNGYYEFPGLTYGDYRVSYEYTFETEAAVKPAGFVIEGRLESATGGLYENAKVKLYVKKTNADGGTVYEDVAQLMTDETGTFRFDVDEKKAVAFTDGNEWYLANSEGVAIAGFDATHLTVGNKQYDINDLYWLEAEDAADAIIVMEAVKPQATKLEVSKLAADVDGKVWPLTHVDLYNGEQYVGTYIINENGEVQADVDLEADVKYSVRVYVPVGPVGREPFASENIALEYYSINASDTAMADAYISNRKADDSINVPYLSGLYDIVGTVIDDDGKTVEGAIVTLLDRDEKPVVRKGLTNPYITGEDGRYEFLGLEPGVYYVTVNYKGQDDALVYEVVIGDGEEHTVTDKTVVEEPAAFEVSIRDYTNGNVTISGEAMSDGALWATEDEALVFIVKSANAAAVAIRVNGELTELVGEKVNNGTYQFVVEGLTADDIVELVTVLVGDITLNGETNSEDLALLASYMFHEYEFTVEPDVQYLAGDVTHNGETNSEDLALLAAAMFHEYDLKWNQR